METTRLGRTGLRVTRTAIGCLPIQRTDKETAKAIIRRAYEGGINFFDTARAYTDSEEKLGEALDGIRENVILATKSGAKNGNELTEQLNTSLRLLKTDHIDLYQFHNPDTLPLPGAADGLYDAALRAKEQGKILHIGITNHSLETGRKAIESGLFETLQYPFNHLSTPEENELVRACAKADVGFICMKGMSGGLIRDARIPFCYIRQFENAVPIWGVQRMEELEQFLALSKDPPDLTGELMELIEKDRLDLAGAFCRSCGYCLPCPVGIPIHNANRMRELMTRAPWEPYASPEWQANMAKIDQCIRCGACAEKCPYGLKPYETLPDQLKWYRAFLREHRL